MCTKQPDLVPKVFTTARNLLQHEDDGIVENGCTVIFELWCDETMDIIEEVIPLMKSASSGVRGVARDILLKMCTKQPDSVPEVLATARKLLQHDDDHIVENGCRVVLELWDETMDIVQEVLPLMESSSSPVQGLARDILLTMCKKQPDLVPEVVGALKKLLPHDDDGIVENSRQLLISMGDAAMDIVQEVLPLMESASIKVRTLARDILWKVCEPQPSLVAKVFAYRLSRYNIFVESVCTLLLPTLEKLLQHEDYSIRADAIRVRNEYLESRLQQKG
jgi:hypothetical protein